MTLCLLACFPFSPSFLACRLFHLNRFSLPFSQCFGRFVQVSLPLMQQNSLEALCI